MGRWLVASLSLLALMSLADIPAIHADVVDVVAKSNGTITDVGVIRGPLQIGGVEYRIRGEILSPVDIDLTAATFRIEEFFVELDGPAGPGAGELMRKSQGPADPASDPLLAPCGPLEANCLLIQTAGDSDDAKFDNVSGFRPHIRVKVTKKEEDDGLYKYKFDVRLDRGMMRDRPLYCPGEHTTYALTEDDDGRFRTTIRNTFTVAEQGNPEEQITVIAKKRWECPQPGRYHLRSR